MYSQVLNAKGLWTYNNPVGPAAVPGSLQVANNVNCDAVDIIETRRGFDFYSAQQFATTNSYIDKLFSYEGTLYTSFNAGQFAQDNGSGSWTVYPNFTMEPPTGGFLHQMLAGGNSYFTTDNGVYKLSGVNSAAPIPAGAPCGLDTIVTTGSTISSGFLNPQSQVAYQVVWGYTDQSNLEVIGAPSYPVYASNGNLTFSYNNLNTTLQFSIPPFVEQNQQLPWFYQIYRTTNTGTGNSLGLLVPPSNELQLVVQANPQSADYTNHYVSYNDDTLDSLLGAYLYTSSGQPDAGNPYDQPPLCQDATYFSNMAFYANYTTAQNVYATLDSVGATQGIQNGDTFSITDSTSGVTYTYTATTGSNNPTTRHFQIDTGGSPATNIQVTAQNLVAVINQDPNNTLYYAQYTSEYGDLPGQILITAQNLSQSNFYLNSSRTTCWTPSVPSSGKSYVSSAVVVPNGLFVSEIGKPESVPPSFQLTVGSPNFPIERIIPVRTALIVIKPEEGVFEITGTSPQQLTVTTLDTTAFIKGSETLAALNNSGYFFTTQGVMLVNESGCQIMSRNIQGDILALASYEYPNFPTLSFAVGYQSDNAYILFLQQLPTDTYSTLQYRYNWITQAWTTWDIPCTAAIVNPANDRLYIATPDGYILEERKTFSSQDFADETTQIQILSINPAGSFALSNSSTVGLGDQISQLVGGSEYTAYVTANDINSNVIQVSSTAGFTNTYAEDTASINSTVTYMPVSGGYDGFIKKFTTWNFEFGQSNFNSCTASFTTDFYPQSESVTLVPKQSGTWGTFPWEVNLWGITSPSLQPISTYSTKNTSIAHWVIPTLNLQQAYQGFSLNGVITFYSFYGDRFR